MMRLGKSKRHVYYAVNFKPESRTMQKHVPAAPATIRPLWVVVLSAGLIVGIAMGLRQVMGLYLQPMTTELGIGREPFSTSMAVANLIWGIGAVAAGMVADRYGAGRVVVGGTLATMAGLYVMYSATDRLRPDGQRRAARHRRQRHRHHRAGGRRGPRRTARQADGRHRLAGHGQRHRRLHRLSLHACADELVGWQASLLS